MLGIGNTQYLIDVTSDTIDLANERIEVNGRRFVYSAFINKFSEEAFSRYTRFCNLALKFV